MPIKMNLNTRIKIDGKEYNSLDEMPPEIRQRVEQALAKGNLVTHINTNSKITFNGQTYNSLDDMPEDVRRIYDSVMSAIDKDRDGVPDALQAGGNLTSSAPLVTPVSSQPGAIEPESPNRSLLILIAAIAILVVLGLAALVILSAR